MHFVQAFGVHSAQVSLNFKVQDTQIVQSASLVNA